MRIEEFLQTWPYLYHMTKSHNLIAIFTYRKLFTADYLLRGANMADMVSLRRSEEILVDLGFFSAVIRNQQPLDPDYLELDLGLSLSDYIRTLNRRVFFWPGTEIGPIKDGERMALRENGTGVILRAPTASILEYNHHILPWFSPYNTGVAWLENGKKSYRGDKSFLLCEQYIEPANKITEVSFEGIVNLPSHTLIASSLRGPWLSIE
jgi:hypothetical protein